jgi:hypothetical protein
MQYPIISTVKANKKSGSLYEPATDSTAKIVYAADETTKIPFKIAVDNVGNWEWPYKMEMGVKMPITLFMIETPKKSWEVSMTDKRIYFWSSWSLGFFGKTPQQKSGKASAGRLPYNSMGKISLGGREDGTYRTMYIDFINRNENEYFSRIDIVDTAETIGKVASALYEYISAYIQSNQKPPEQEMNEWNNYKNTDWSVGNIEILLPAMK